MSETQRIWVTEVHNFGGFFGGDTVTLSATPWPPSVDAEEATLTIDERALANIAGRHSIAPAMLLELRLSGDRVDQARIVAARERESLSAALLTAPTDTLTAPRLRAFRCPHCALWVAGAPEGQPEQRCTLCGVALP